MLVNSESLGERPWPVVGLVPRARLAEEDDPSRPAEVAAQVAEHSSMMVLMNPHSSSMPMASG